MKKIITFVLISLFSLSAKAEIINDFSCTLNEGYTVPKLYQFQQEWMQVAAKKGFDASYKTKVLFPLYAKKMSAKPLAFIWRGYFKDGEQLGRMLDWFPTSEWAAKFVEVMECKEGSLWNAPV